MGQQTNERAAAYEMGRRHAYCHRLACPEQSEDESTYMAGYSAEHSYLRSDEGRAHMAALARVQGGAA